CRLAGNGAIKSIRKAVQPDEQQSHQRITEPKGRNGENANKKADQRNLIGAYSPTDKPGSKAVRRWVNYFADLSVEHGGAALWAKA
ncbi:MAG: hypothetical protein ACO3NE_04185, partial [Alphaproteobacteria bacterium]